MRARPCRGGNFKVSISIVYDFREKELKQNCNAVGADQGPCFLKPRSGQGERILVSTARSDNPPPRPPLTYLSHSKFQLLQMPYIILNKQ